MAKKQFKKPFKFMIYAGGIVLVAWLIALIILSLLKLNFRLSSNGLEIVSDNSITTDNNYLLINDQHIEFATALADNFSLDYDVEPSSQASGTVRIPVFTYHHVDDLKKNPKGRDYYVSPTIFEEQLIYLQEKNYKTLTMQEFYDYLKTGKNPKQKSIVLTFDDGNYDNYQYAFPLLKKYGMIGIFYVPSSKRGISTAQLKEMSDAGMIIEPHGKTHMLLSKITVADLLYQEIAVSKSSLESITGKKVLSFCYPGCEYNGTVLSTLASNGYQLAFTCGRSIDHKLSRRFYLERMHVYNDMNHFKSILSGKSYYPSFSD